MLILKGEKYNTTSDSCCVHVAEGEGVIPGGTLVINENTAGEEAYDVRGYALAKVNVPQGTFTEGAIEITENGEHDVDAYKTAKVNVPQGTFTEGAVEITENGEHDVDAYKTAKVNVPQGTFTEGAVEITENGEHDVDAYKTAKVAVPQPKCYAVTLGRIAGAESITILYSKVTDGIAKYETWTINGSSSGAIMSNVQGGSLMFIKADGNFATLPTLEVGGDLEIVSLQNNLEHSLCIVVRVGVGGGSIDISEFTENKIKLTENGEHIVSGYDIAEVAVPQGVFPEGTLDITENGEYDVLSYEKVKVDNAELAELIKYYTRQTTDLILPKNVTSLMPFAFNGHQYMTSVSGLDNVASIGRYAFYGCSTLTELVLPATETLELRCFQNCTGLTKVTFKTTPTSIDPTAFQGCDGITTINCPWAEGAVANAPWGATNANIVYNYAGE